MSRVSEFWANFLTRRQQLETFASLLEAGDYEAPTQLAEALVTLGYTVTFEPLTREHPNDGVSARIERAGTILDVGSGDTIEDALGDLTRKIIANGGLPS